MELMILITWFMFGAACGMIAEKKNRDQNLWFIFGIIGGFVTLLIILGLPPA